MSLVRADIVLVDLGLAKSRSHAKQLIDEAVVFHEGTCVKKAGQRITTENIEIKKDTIYASRGAHKVEGAFDEFNIDPEGKVIADVGASTGGFTDYVLRNGAEFVYAIDVGHGQLAQDLCENSSVKNLEGTNIRYPLKLDQSVDIAVVDLSFISLRLTFETIFSLVKDGGDIIALVKPQFEAGKGNIGRNGIVTDENRIIAINDLYDWLCENNYIVQKAMRSPITGKGGNIEYFFHFIKNKKDSEFNKDTLGEL